MRANKKSIGEPNHRPAGVRNMQADYIIIGAGSVGR